MKETDYSVVRQKAEKCLQSQQWELLSYITIDNASYIVANIYMMSDKVVGYGQDIVGGLSIISSVQTISTIYGKTASHYKADLPICGYEDLETDIEYIIICIDASLLRMQQ